MITAHPIPGIDMDLFSSSCRFAARAVQALTGGALLMMVLLAASDLFLRLFDVGIEGSSVYVQNLCLWLGFLGALVAASQKRHLVLVNMTSLMPERIRGITEAVAGGVSAGVTTGLCWASWQFVRAEMGSPMRIAGWLPQWVPEAILPAVFGLMTLQWIDQTSGLFNRMLVAAGALAAGGIGFAAAPYLSQLAGPMIIGLICISLLGVPIFVVLGGVALLLFLANGVPIASIPVETYRITVSPVISAVPLFTLAGYILAEGGASGRMVGLFRALVGWMPGGIAIVTILVCAFFTTFTGASGVTILALGGFLLPALLQEGYREHYSLGLITSCGSLGLLFPPSLPVILYGVVAHVSILDLFKAGAIPGALMVFLFCVSGVYEGRHAAREKAPFNFHELMKSVWMSKWDIAFPIVVLVGIFGGYCTLLEGAAVSVLFAAVIETVIYRTLDPWKDLPSVFLKCASLIGGVFIILGVSMGLTNYMVDAEIPMRAADWVQLHIGSKWIFLLYLNLLLLLVGCLMDIFSAIAVVVPLILPVSEVFGVHPLHLGIIFLSNLELGYLTPPVGMNLFLASYRFNKPLFQVYRDSLPFSLILLAVVLIVTYAPVLLIGV
ncbi:MAG: TRAP transporter large permease subunit [Hyphomicrobiales bacterium]